MMEYYTYYADGALYEKIEIDESRKLHGSYRSYYKSGNKKMELYYNRGIINGCGISWYETGEIHAQFTYDNGELVGNPMIYSDSGKIEYRE
jgi:antitoxin component YwqK of YwqJK toxin-antitoxin module